MSNLFNDTTRLRLHTRPSLSNMFSHEAPPIVRPKDPPPPPPPVEHVLLPVTPPRKFFPMFTNDELDRINSVINCRGKEIVIDTETEDTETIDEFSTDEFSEDEFDQATYENILSSEPKDSEDEDSGNVYDSVPEIMEEDSLEEKMSFGAEYDTSEAGNSPPPPLPITPPPYMLEAKLAELEISKKDEEDSNEAAASNKLNPELIEKATEKTVIFTSSQINKSPNTSSQVAANTNTKEPEILISSSSWIDLQSIQIPNNEAINTDSDFVANVESLCVLSSPSIDVKDEVVRVKEASEMNNDSLEPIKPPRLKKMARLQQQQQLQKQKNSNGSGSGPQQALKWQASKESLEQHLKDRMKKISNHMEQPQQQPQNRQPASLRPDMISHPILMATTLNPNDADGHRSLSTFNPNSIQSHWDHLNKSVTSPASKVPSSSTPSKASSSSSPIASNNPTSPNGANDKITFKDLKRYATNSFASLSSGITQNGWRSLNFIASSNNRTSTFYEADTSQEAIYEDASKMQRQTSPTYSDHIYEEIPECKHVGGEVEQQRPLPPIPESKQVDSINATTAGNKLNQSGASTSSATPPRKTPVRNGSFFEGASKYEILHYLKDAKDRMGHGDFEIDLDDSSSAYRCAIPYFVLCNFFQSKYFFSETYPHGFIGRRNLNHRISSISHVSDSSVDSDEGILRHKLNSSIIDIERTDSGVGSETSKSSKASVEIRRAPSLSKSSDSGSGSGHEIPDVCPDCEQELGNDHFYQCSVANFIKIIKVVKTDISLHAVPFVFCYYS